MMRVTIEGELDRDKGVVELVVGGPGGLVFPVTREQIIQLLFGEVSARSVKVAKNKKGAKARSSNGAALRARFAEKKAKGLCIWCEKKRLDGKSVCLSHSKRKTKAKTKAKEKHLNGVAAS